MLKRIGKIYALTAFVGVTGCNLNAQTFALPFDLNESSPTVDFAIDVNGNMLDRGPATDTGPVAPVATMAAGSQLLWSPAYAIFRAGYFSTPLSTSNMGEFSVALGYNSVAQGVASTGIGGGTALAEWAVAIGLNSTASGFGTLALGTGSVASGNNASAIQGGDATGNYATAIAIGSLASGYYSTAIGCYATAAVIGSTALGSYALANGSGSMALGYSTIAHGSYSTAAGFETVSNSAFCFVTGCYNSDLSETGAAPNPTAWVATDPIFEVGNGQGTEAASQSTALVVYKNGDAAFPTTSSSVTANRFVMTTASGDIPMYTGN